MTREEGLSVQQSSRTSNTAPPRPSYPSQPQEPEKIPQSGRLSDGGRRSVSSPRQMDVDEFSSGRHDSRIERGHRQDLDLDNRPQSRSLENRISSQPGYSYRTEEPPPSRARGRDSLPEPPRDSRDDHRWAPNHEERPASREDYVESQSRNLRVQPDRAPPPPHAEPLRSSKPPRSQRPPKAASTEDVERNGVAHGGFAGGYEDRAPQRPPLRTSSSGSLLQRLSVSGPNPSSLMDRVGEPSRRAMDETGSQPFDGSFDVDDMGGDMGTKSRARRRGPKPRRGRKNGAP